ncbi:hypothetical protein B0A49_05259 [Cryomyces minteri]|uniref:RNA polymerase I-specific transcription initiation factor rrn3 n=1 Tax=Cryomyces minteri TaxID=331657 RepID=A0A4U0XFD3_9PEZI|nr:hypothetical protein B0A49_05259 [Cryomyces minteri]
MDDLEEEMGDKIVQDMQQKTIRNLEDSEASDDSDNESVSSSEDSSTPEEMRMKELKSAVATMDAILDLLFGYYTPIFANGTAWDIDETFEHLLLQFANIVLPTYRSRHTQFLLFHFGQLSPDLIAKFAGACGHLALTKERIPQLVRLSAATYLASFVARGARISSQVVRDVFDLLGSHLDYIRRTEEPTCRGPELVKYSLYYALAQAVLYIFCFRWRDLVVNSADPNYDIDELDDAALFDGRELNWAPGIKECLTQNIYSKLNPLKVCSPSIVQQFARISRHLQFMYIFPLLETNKRLRLSTFLGATSASDGAFGGIARETALTGKLGESYHQLDAYFPFDPYQLPRSKRWLEGDYVQWKGIPGLDDDDKDDDSSDSDESEEDSDEDEAGEEEVDTDTESP